MDKLGVFVRVGLGVGLVRRGSGFALQWGIFADISGVVLLLWIITVI